jgi:type IV secretion system protein VirD4
LVNIDSEKKQKLFACAVVFTAGLILFVQAKILFLVVILSVCVYFLCNNGNKSQKIGIALLPISAGLLFSWCAAGVTQNILVSAAKFKEQPAPPALSYKAWIGAETPAAAGKADVVGRWALLVGAGVGFLIAIKVRPSARHGPGVVGGRRVLEGGWSSLDDLASVCDFGPPRENEGGLPLGKLQGQIVRLNPQKGKVKMAGHALIAGATGTGKSYTCIRNLIIAAVCDGHSIVITDPKGELFEDMGGWLKGKGYELLGFNVSNPGKSHRWNPLLECQGYEDIMDLAEWLINAAGDDHAFFSGGEKNILAAALAYTRWVLPESQQHLASALSILSWQQEVLHEKYNEAFGQKKVPKGAYETWCAAQGHYNNYIEGVRNKVRSITKGSLSALTAGCDFDLADIGKRKTALFLILPDEGDMRSLYVPFYAFMFRRLREVAELSSGGRLPVPTRFILDEFANIGRIPEIDKVCALGRSRGIMIQIAIQNLGQMKGLYAREKAWEAVLGNMPVKICLSTDDLDTARYFTNMMGDARVYDISESRDISTPWAGLEVKKRESTKDKHVMAPWELLQLPEDDCIVLLRGKRPSYMQKIPWVELPQAKEIQSSPKLRAEEMLPDTTPAELPDFPEAKKPVEKDQGRGRGGKSKVKKKSEPAGETKALFPDDEEVKGLLGIDE